MRICAASGLKHLVSIPAELVAHGVTDEILGRLCVDRGAWHKRSELALEDVVAKCSGPACLLVNENEVLEMRSCAQEVSVVDCGVAEGESPATVGKRLFWSFDA